MGPRGALGLAASVQAEYVDVPLVASAHAGEEAHLRGHRHVWSHRSDAQLARRDLANGLGARHRYSYEQAVASPGTVRESAPAGTATALGALHKPELRLPCAAPLHQPRAPAAAPLEPPSAV